MSQTKTGYKVVRAINGKLLSAIEWCTTEYNKYNVEYRLNFQTKPKKNCGPLCVFQEPEQASDFLRWAKAYFGCPGQIYRCEYVLSKHSEIWIPVSGYCETNEYLPLGTVFASSVKLLELIRTVNHEH
jgi:hypothetical protein